MPWIRKQLGGDLRRDRRCKTHKRPVVKTKNEKNERNQNQRRRNIQRTKNASQKTPKKKKLSNQITAGDIYI